MKKVQSISAIIVIILFQSIFAATALTPQINTDNGIKNELEVENNQEISQVKDISAQQISLVKGCDELAVNIGVSTLVNNLNDEVKINHLNDINSSDNNEILVIFSHGTEEGIIINDNLITWLNLALILKQIKVNKVYLATCYGANIYNFTQGADKTIIGWKGISDAIIMGLSLAYLINSQYLHLNDALLNIMLLKPRFVEIIENPGTYLALFYTKVENHLIVDTVCFLIWCWDMIVWDAEILHIKLSAEETNTLTPLTLGYTLFVTLAPIPSALKMVIALNMILFGLMIWVSQEYHPDGGAWVSWEAVVWPPHAIWIQSRKPDGSIPFCLPMVPDPVTAKAVYEIMKPFEHDWTWHDLPTISLQTSEIPAGTSLTAGSSDSVSFNLENTGIFTSTLDFQVTGLPTEYYTIPPSITLESGQTEQVSLDIHPPINAPTENLEYMINILCGGEVVSTVNSILSITDEIAPDFDLFEKIIEDSEDFNYFVDVLTVEGASSVSAELYYEGNLIGVDNSPTISSITDGERYTFEFVKPTLLGNYTISITASDISGNTRTKSSVIHYIDDDSYGPDIIINPDLQTITDADETFSFAIAVSDPSGISSISVQYDDNLMGTSSGLYTIVSSKKIGHYTILVDAIDNDIDRGEIDKASISSIGVVYIIDDDITPPEINISYEGSQTDGDPGKWLVSVEDLESGVDEINISVDDILVGTSEGEYSVPNSLGVHTIEVMARNADLDRGIIDQEHDTKKSNITIIDDDINPPEISNLAITDDIHEVHISFNAIDDNSSDDQGIGEIKLFIDNELTSTYIPSETEIFFDFNILNDWIMETGTHEILIETTDADDDRENDAETTITYGYFEITPDEMMDYILWEMDELKDFIDDNVFFLFDWILINQLDNAKDKVQQALNWYNTGSQTKPVILDKLAKSNLDLLNILTTILDDWMLISEADGDYISTESHEIRDHITLAMGAIIGTTPALSIADNIIAIEQLADKIFEEQNLWVALSIDIFLWSASDMLDNALITMSMDSSTISLILEDISKANLKLADIITFMWEEFGCVSEADGDYISQTLHSIRDSITLTMGEIVGTEVATKIAQIEVEIEQFADGIFDGYDLSVALQIDIGLWGAAEFLDLALISLSIDSSCGAEINLLLAKAELCLTKAIVNGLKDCADLTDEQATAINEQIDDFINDIMALCDHSENEGYEEGDTDTNTHGGTGESDEDGSDSSSSSGDTDDPNTDVPTH